MQVVADLLGFLELAFHAPLLGDAVGEELGDGAPFVGLGPGIAQHLVEQGLGAEGLAVVVAEHQRQRQLHRVAGRQRGIVARRDFLAQLERAELAQAVVGIEHDARRVVGGRYDGHLHRHLDADLFDDGAGRLLRAARREQGHRHRGDGGKRDGWPRGQAVRDFRDRGVWAHGSVILKCAPWSAGSRSM